MYRVAERVEDGGQIVRDIVRDFERVKRRDHQVFREAARTVHAHADGVAAQVGTPTATVAAVTTGNVAFTGDAVANVEAFHFLADADYFADIFRPTTIGTGIVFATTGPSCRCERQYRRWRFYEF